MLISFKNSDLHFFYTLEVLFSPFSNIIINLSMVLQIHGFLQFTDFLVL